MAEWIRRAKLGKLNDYEWVDPEHGITENWQEAFSQMGLEYTNWANQAKPDLKDPTRGGCRLCLTKRSVIIMPEIAGRSTRACYCMVCGSYASFSDFREGNSHLMPDPDLKLPKIPT